MRDAASRAHRQGHLAEAAKLYARHLAAHPDDAGVWSNLGVLHRVAGRHDQALRAQRRAAALDPEAAGVRNNLANILSDIGDYDASLALRRDILVQQPDNAAQKAMIGRCLRGQGKYADAISYLRGAIADHPDDTELQMQLAFARLGNGDYADGFETYRARWNAGELTPRDLDFPEWNGEPLAGKTVLVLPEQGFGDAIMFARFLPALKALGPKVLVLAEAPMLRLFADLDGVDWVGTKVDAAQPADFWINSMDAARIHFANDGAVPPPAKMHIPQDAQERAKALVAPYTDVFRIGVVWTGSLTYKGNTLRSFSHREYLPLTDLSDVQVFSLYKGPALAAYEADGTSGFIMDAASSERDFADSAATMQQMDLVITSDTATAHLAGSLGGEVWTVLHWDPFWTWRHTGEDVAWYPNMRLFRQSRPMDWGGVMQDVHAALRQKMKERQ